MTPDEANLNRTMKIREENVLELSGKFGKHALNNFYQYFYFSFVVLCSWICNFVCIVIKVYYIIKLQYCSKMYY